MGSFWNLYNRETNPVDKKTAQARRIVKAARAKAKAKKEAEAATQRVITQQKSAKVDDARERYRAANRERAKRRAADAKLTPAERRKRNTTLM